MTDIELGWVAGIVDGEGCIHISKLQSVPTCRSPVYRLVLRVTMGHLPTVQRLHTLTGQGTVQKHAPRGPQTNASYTWMCQQLQTAAILRQLRPYLVTKAVEADLGLKFAALPLSPRGGQCVPRVLLAQREKMYWAMRRLKPRWRFSSAHNGRQHRRSRPKE
jgi:hypothetical protein